SKLRAGIKKELGSKNAIAGDIYINVAENINIENQSEIRNFLEPKSLGDGGETTIKTNNFFITDSKIFNDTTSSGNAGNLTVEAKNKLEIISNPINLTLDKKGVKGLFSRIAPEATGNGGNITVTASDMTVSGKGGIGITVDGSGKAGNVTINTNRLKIIEGASVTSNTAGTGDAGEIIIKASDSIEVSNIISDSKFANIPRKPQGIIADVRTGGRGNGGNITLETGRLSLRDGAIVATDTKGPGDAGNILIRSTDFVEVIGSLNFDINKTQIVTAVRKNGIGKGGDLVIETKDLTIRNGGAINVGTIGISNSGNLDIKAEGTVQLFGIDKDGIPSSIVAQTHNKEAEAAGGNITLTAENLILQNGGQISASTFGKGNAGNINIKVNDSITVNGFTGEVSQPQRAFASILDDSENVYFSGIFSNSPGIGNAGDLNIETGKLNLENKAQISVSSQQQGAAGNLNIQAEKMFLDNATINADTVAGDKGSIYLSGADIRLRQGSRVTTNATQTATGGNIDIDSLTLVGLENSDITANAEDNFGGRVIINAEALFGIAFRDFLTTESDITASSALGTEFNGVVEINTPDIDPTSALEELPETFTDPSQIKAGCAADGGNKFAQTGRGGLPKSPQEVLRSQVVVEDLRISLKDSFQDIDNAKLKPIEKSKVNQIIEARRFIVNKNGVIELVANLPQENGVIVNKSVSCG
ncbi:MAG: S-layer family protein, partial [Cyanobacteria bacterium J06621_15]